MRMGTLSLDDLFTAGIPATMVEAVCLAYSAIFESTGGDAAQPAMEEHGTVDGVGPGKHKVVMKPGDAGYSIDGSAVGWSNPGGTYETGSGAQKAFAAAYAAKIAKIMPGLDEADRVACAKVMGDYDGLWWFKYDNGQGRKNCNHAREDVVEFGKRAGISVQEKVDAVNDAITRAAMKNAVGGGDEGTEWFIKWLEGAGIELNDDALDHARKLIASRTEEYKQEREAVSKIGHGVTVSDLKELTVTDTGLGNQPNSEEIWQNLGTMAGRLKRLRELIPDLKIHVNSCYRSPAVNRAVHGVPTSAHTKGLAMDLSAGSDADNRKMYDVLDRLVEPWDIDQLIMYNTKKHDRSSPVRFIHVGFRADPSSARHQRLFSA